MTMYEWLPVAQTVQDGASNANFIGSIPRESNDWQKMCTLNSVLAALDKSIYQMPKCTVCSMVEDSGKQLTKTFKI